MRISAQLRARIESRSAVYYFLGIKGEPFTDHTGRRAAVGRFGYECTGNEDIEPQNRERIEVEVQVCEDASAGWQPVGGMAAGRRNRSRPRRGTRPSGEDRTEPEGDIKGRGQGALGRPRSRFRDPGVV
jgi:hypothetical protein